MEYQSWKLDSYNYLSLRIFYSMFHYVSVWAPAYFCPR